MSGRANFEETMAKELAKLEELNEGLPPLPDDLLKQLDEVKKAYVETVNAHEKVFSPEGERLDEDRGKQMIEDARNEVKHQEEMKDQLRKEVNELLEQREQLMSKDISQEVKAHQAEVKANEDKIKELRDKTIPETTEEIHATARTIEDRKREEINIEERLEILKKTLSEKENEYRLLCQGNIMPSDYQIVMEELNKIKKEIDTVNLQFKLISDHLYCGKCNTIMVNPYTLFKCGHSYCAKCLGIEPFDPNNPNNNNSSDNNNNNNNNTFITIPKDINYVYNYLLANRSNLIQMFTALDKNGDGVLSYSEFVNGFRTLGIEVEEGVLDEIWDFTDVNGGGTLEYSEFFQILSHTRRATAFANANKENESKEKPLKFPQRIDNPKVVIYCPKCIMEVKLKCVYNYNLNSIISKYIFYINHQVDLMSLICELEDTIRKAVREE